MTPAAMSIERTRAKAPKAIRTSDVARPRTLALSVLGAAPAESLPQPTPADLVLRNGAVYTVDAARSWARAVAVSGGKIVCVGTDAAVAPWIGAAVSLSQTKPVTFCVTAGAGLLPPPLPPQLRTGLSAGGAPPLADAGPSAGHRKS